MIYPQTLLTVADNTGARKIMCIRVLGGNRKYAKIGDTIIGVVKEAIHATAAGPLPSGPCARCLPIASRR